MNDVHYSAVVVIQWPCVSRRSLPALIGYLTLVLVFPVAIVVAWVRHVIVFKQFNLISAFQHRCAEVGILRLLVHLQPSCTASLKSHGAV